MDGLASKAWTICHFLPTLNVVLFSNVNQTVLLTKPNLNHVDGRSENSHMNNFSHDHKGIEKKNCPPVDGAIRSEKACTILEGNVNGMCLLV